MKFKTYYFHFTAPLHLGNHRPESYEKSEVILHSDTIMAAIMNAWARMGKNEWIYDYVEHPDFVISSAFPFQEKEGEKIHFFPRPLLRWEIEYDPDYSKKIKKVSWLDQHFFEILIKGEDLAELENDYSLIQGEYLSVRAIGGNLIKREMQDRVVVPRDYSIEKDARPFTMERLRFRDEAGLFILVDQENERLRNGLELVQYEGFGTDRSVGNGLFELEEGDLEVSCPEGTDMSMNMGLYVPESESGLKQQLSENASFGLLKRGGWVTSENYLQYEKNSVYMFAEGSVLRQNPGLSGKAKLDLTPPVMKVHHSIYRSGRSIFIPVNVKP